MIRTVSPKLDLTGPNEQLIQAKAKELLMLGLFFPKCGPKWLVCRYVGPTSFGLILVFICNKPTHSKKVIAQMETRLSRKVLLT